LVFQEANVSQIRCHDWQVIVARTNAYWRLQWCDYQNLVVLLTHGINMGAAIQAICLLHGFGDYHVVGHWYLHLA
jgi:hypothetical protein